MTGFLLVFLFISTVPILADNMAASGATTTVVNDIYINMGIHATLSDGVDYYQKGSIYLYRADNSGAKAWIIGTELGSKDNAKIYYGTDSNQSTPDGLSLSSTGDLGTGGPTINETSLAVELISFVAKKKE